MTKKELTASEYEEMVSTGSSKPLDNKSYTRYGIIVAVVLVLCGISFGLGTVYQKGKHVATSNARNEQSGTQDMSNGRGGFGGGPGGFGNGQRPNIGQVTAVSSDSITIQDSRSGSNQTFKITSSTTIQNNGSTASASDIKTGDTALVVADSTDTSMASQIMLNPSFGGGQPSSTTQDATPPSDSDIDAQSI